MNLLDQLTRGPKLTAAEPSQRQKNDAVLKAMPGSIKDISRAAHLSYQDADKRAREHVAAGRAYRKRDIDDPAAPYIYYRMEEET